MIDLEAVQDLLGHKTFLVHLRGSKKKYQGNSDFTIINYSENNPAADRPLLLNDTTYDPPVDTSVTPTYPMDKDFEEEDSNGKYLPTKMCNEYESDDRLCKKVVDESDSDTLALKRYFKRQKKKRASTKVMKQQSCSTGGGDD